MKHFGEAGNPPFVGRPTDGWRKGLFVAGAAMLSMVGSIVVMFVVAFRPRSGAGIDYLFGVTMFLAIIVFIQGLVIWKLAHQSRLQ